MINREIILRITNNKIWFNNTDFIDSKNTDIPIEHLSFSYHREIFWKVQMKKFDKSSKKLSVDIINYNFSDFPTFSNQKPTKEIKYLEFKTFNWGCLEPLLSSYQRSKFINQLTNINDIYKDKPKEENSIKRSDKLELSQLTNLRVENFQIKKEPIVTKFEEDFAIDFNDSAFMLGYVSFSKYIKKLDKT